MADKKSLVNIDFGGASSIKNLPSASPAASDCLAITDYSDGGKVKKGPAIGSSDGMFLRHDGSWATPSGGGGMYIHLIQIRVTNTLSLFVKITTSQSTPYGNIERIESMVSNHMHYLYNTQGGTYKPIFIVNFYGEYGYFDYIDTMNGSFGALLSYSDIQYNVVRDDVWQT